MDLVWLTWSLGFILLWLCVYVTIRSDVSRREMLIVSLWTSLLGLTEPLFVPEYWNPPSLFDLARTTGFDIESLIFCFGVGGIAEVIYERIVPVRHLKMTIREILGPRHRFHPAAIIAAPVLFVILMVLTPINPIYNGVISLMVSGFLTWYCRPDLWKKMIVSGLIFLGLYFAYFYTLIIFAPGYVERVWNISALSGILVAGVPVEELLFAFSFGFFWSSLYEHLTWRKLEEGHESGAGEG
ncbi:MAG: lycopene cyclase domain-containing protein [Methanoregulaceae archaeon]|nr:lycopene cyclase domain-containing protein [Methanoregulaceae archaeon]